MFLFKRISISAASISNLSLVNYSLILNHLRHLGLELYCQGSYPLHYFLSKEIRPNDIDIVAFLPHHIVRETIKAINIDSKTVLKDIIQALPEKILRSINISTAIIPDRCITRSSKYIQINVNDMDITIYPFRWSIGQGMSTIDYLFPITTRNTLDASCVLHKELSNTDNYPYFNDLVHLQTHRHNSSLQVSLSTEMDQGPFWKQVMCGHVQCWSQTLLVQSLMDSYTVEPKSTYSRFEPSVHYSPLLYNSEPNSKGVLHYFFIGMQLEASALKSFLPNHTQFKAISTRSKYLDFYQKKLSVTFTIPSYISEELILHIQSALKDPKKSDHSLHSKIKELQLLITTYRQLNQFFEHTKYSFKTIQDLFNRAQKSTKHSGQSKSLLDSFLYVIKSPDKFSLERECSRKFLSLFYQCPIKYIPDDFFTITPLHTIFKDLICYFKETNFDWIYPLEQTQIDFFNTILRSYLKKLPPCNMPTQHPNFLTTQATKVELIPIIESKTFDQPSKLHTPPNSPVIPHKAHPDKKVAKKHTPDTSNSPTLSSPHAPLNSQATSRSPLDELAHYLNLTPTVSQKAKPTLERINKLSLRDKIAAISLFYDYDKPINKKLSNHLKDTFTAWLNTPLISTAQILKLCSFESLIELLPTDFFLTKLEYINSKHHKAIHVCLSKSNPKLLEYRTLILQVHTILNKPVPTKSTKKKKGGKKTKKTSTQYLMAPIISLEFSSILNYLGLLSDEGQLFRKNFRDLTSLQNTVSDFRVNYHFHILQSKLTTTPPTDDGFLWTLLFSTFETHHFSKELLPILSKLIQNTRSDTTASLLLSKIDGFSKHQFDSILTDLSITSIDQLPKKSLPLPSQLTHLSFESLAFESIPQSIMHYIVSSMGLLESASLSYFLNASNNQSFVSIIMICSIYEKLITERLLRPKNLEHPIVMTFRKTARASFMKTSTYSTDLQTSVNLDKLLMVSDKKKLTLDSLFNFFDTLLCLNHCDKYLVPRLHPKLQLMVLDLFERFNELLSYLGIKCISELHIADKYKPSNLSRCFDLYHLLDSYPTIQETLLKVIQSFPLETDCTETRTSINLLISQTNSIKLLESIHTVYDLRSYNKSTQDPSLSYPPIYFSIQNKKLEILDFFLTVVYKDTPIPAIHDRSLIFYAFRPRPSKSIARLFDFSAVTHILKKSIHGLTELLDNQNIAHHYFSYPKNSSFHITFFCGYISDHYPELFSDIFNHQDNKGNTPLHYLFESRATNILNNKIIHYFFNHAAINLSLKNIDQKTPLDILKLTLIKLNDITQLIIDTADRDKKLHELALMNKTINPT